LKNTLLIAGFVALGSFDIHDIPSLEVFVIETKNVHGKVYGSGNAEFWKQYLPDWGYKS